MYLCIFVILCFLQQENKKNQWLGFSSDVSLVWSVDEVGYLTALHLSELIEIMGTRFTLQAIRLTLPKTQLTHPYLIYLTMVPTITRKMCLSYSLIDNRQACLDT